MAEYQHQRRGNNPRYGGRGGSDYGGKRKRQDEDDDGGMRSLCYALFYLGDRKKGAALVDERPREVQISALAPEVRRLIGTRQTDVNKFLLDCTVQLGHKVANYALLIGLLNADDPTSIAALVDLAAEGFGAALQKQDSSRARLLLRLLTALVIPGVLQPATVLHALTRIVKSALEIAADAGDGSDGRTWQPYTDSLVHAVLMALPWGGVELVGTADGKGDGRPEMEELWKALTAYMAARPRQHQPGLAPFFPSAGIAIDATTRSDSGGASFLGQLWAAVREWRESKYSPLPSIPVLELQESEAVLATGQPCQLPELNVPKDPIHSAPGAPPAEAAAAVNKAFPPRGGIQLLAPEHTRGDRSVLERIVGEEYILDSMLYFDGDRVESAVRLANGLPLPYKHESLLAEVLFSQMLNVPSPRHKPLAYAALMVDLCKLLPAFPRSMSTCVRECFTRMKALDPQLRVRLAEWQAYHMSNYDFMWPWVKWSQVLTANPRDPQRRYAVDLMSRLIRLSYFDRVHDVIPDDFKPLLPPKPAVQPLPAADVSAAESATAVPEGNSIEAIETAAAAQMLVKIRAKASHEALQSWVEGGELVGALGGPVGAVACVARALLVAGGKSFTHTVIALERYLPLLQHLIETAGGEGEQAIVGVAARVWAASPLRGAMAIDRLMALRLASGASIAAWSFATLQKKRLDDELGAGLAWEALYAAVNKTIARTQDAMDDVKDARRQVKLSNASLSEEEVEAALSEPKTAQELAVKEQQALLTQVLQSFRDLIATATDEVATAEAAALSAARQAPADMQLEVSTSEAPTDANISDASLTPAAADGDAKPTAEAVSKHTSEDAPKHSTAASKTPEAAAAAGAASWRSFVIAYLRSFVRTYSLQLAPLAAHIDEQMFSASMVADDVRAATILSLYL